MAYINALRQEIPIPKMTPEQRRLYNNERSKAAYYRRRASKQVAEITDHQKFMTDLVYAVHRKHGNDTPAVFMDLARKALDTLVNDRVTLIRNAQAFLAAQPKVVTMGDLEYAHEAQLAQEAQQA